MKKRFVIISAIVLMSLPLFGESRASIDASPSLSLSTLVKKALEKKYNSAEIRLPSLEKLERSSAIAEFDELTSARLIEDKANGVAVLEVSGLIGEKESSQVIQTPFEAWIHVPVANRRIYPNTKLKSEDFRIQPVNVSSGAGRDYRGVMVSAETNFEKMESRQSILEGQFVVSSAIQKQPDVRRGESVKLELVSGELSLSTQAIAQDAASIGDTIRVLTIKSKREITGRLKENNTVEVSL